MASATRPAPPRDRHLKQQQQRHKEVAAIHGQRHKASSTTRPSPRATAAAQRGRCRPWLLAPLGHPHHEAVAWSSSSSTRRSLPSMASPTRPAPPQGRRLEQQQRHKEGRCRPWPAPAAAAAAQGGRCHPWPAPQGQPNHKAVASSNSSGTRRPLPSMASTTRPTPPRGRRPEQQQRLKEIAAVHGQPN